MKQQKKAIMLSSKAEQHGPSTMLLYACCGPCACSVFESGYQNSFNITIFFFGSHLDSEEEYNRRLEGVSIVNEKLNHSRDMIIHQYDPAELKNHIDYQSEAFTTNNHRCQSCILRRLAVTNSVAAGSSFDSFATTLSVSPHQNSVLINNIGKDISNQSGIRFIEMNLKKNDGFKKSVLKSKELGLYRQNYCGCSKSVR